MDEMDEKITITILGRKVSLSLNQIHKLQDVLDEAERKITVRLRKLKYQKLAKGDPDELVEYITKRLISAELMDYSIPGEYDQEAFDLLKYVETERLKKLVKNLGQEFKTEALRILKERNALEEPPNSDGRDD